TASGSSACRATASSTTSARAATPSASVDDMRSRLAVCALLATLVAAAGSSPAGASNSTPCTKSASATVRPEGLHPNDRGHQKATARLIETITQLTGLRPEENG